MKKQINLILYKKRAFRKLILKALNFLNQWRSERDSNSRTAKPPNDLANRPLQPLEYRSVKFIFYHYTINYIIIQLSHLKYIFLNLQILKLNTMIVKNTKNNVG